MRESGNIAGDQVMWWHQWRRWRSGWVLAGTIVFLSMSSTVVHSQEGSPPSLPAPRVMEEPGVQPLEKGPIHEAFADPGSPTRGEGMVAPKAPPPPVPEEPPESKPEGENVRWIPGYWYWDAQRQDFIWVSGFWRNVPPDRVWEPGKWYEEGGKWVYRPGFWRPASMTSWRVDLPQPPAPVEQGPSTPPPTDDAVWVPGYWEYRDGRYVWRAGYWAYPNSVLVWHPPQYLCCGSTYLFVPGYWDYPLEWRGILYTPVAFTRPLWLRAGWCWRPRLAISLGLGWGWGYGGLFSSLYIGPGWYYYYGSWWDPWWYTPWWWYPSLYGPPLWNVGIGLGWWYGGWWGWPARYCPWWCTRPGFWNPLWRHYCWLNRNNPNWRTRVQTAALVSNLGNSARAVSAVSGMVTAGGAPSAANRATLAGGTAGAARAVSAAAARQVLQRQQNQLILPADRVVRSLQQRDSLRWGEPLQKAANSGTAAGIGAVPSVRPGPAFPASVGSGAQARPPGVATPSPATRPAPATVEPPRTPPPSTRPTPAPANSVSGPVPNIGTSPSRPNVTPASGLLPSNPAGSPQSITPVLPWPPSTPPVTTPPSSPPPPVRPTVPAPVPSRQPIDRTPVLPPVVRPASPSGVPPAFRSVPLGRPSPSPSGGLPGGGLPRGGLLGGVRPGGVGPRR